MAEVFIAPVGEKVDAMSDYSDDDVRCALELSDMDHADELATLRATLTAEREAHEKTRRERDTWREQARKDESWAIAEAHKREEYGGKLAAALDALTVAREALLRIVTCAPPPPATGLVAEFGTIARDALSAIDAVTKKD